MNGLNADDALRRISQVSGDVRRSSRWVGRWMLVAGLLSTVYWVAMLLGPGPVQTAAILGWGSFVAGSFLYIFRKGVYSRLAMRLQWPVAAAYLGTVTLATLFSMFVLPGDPGGGWAALAAAVAIMASAPLLWGAWRLLRAADVTG
ncbi:hypothetical protein [Streptosporangium sp. KLBMP 9127]|nr:hypothetical protein [Streptosporangium sp. KLBMP 9127]